MKNLYDHTYNEMDPDQINEVSRDVTGVLGPVMQMSDMILTDSRWPTWSAHIEDCITNLRERANHAGALPWPETQLKADDYKERADTLSAWYGYLKTRRATIDASNDRANHRAILEDLFNRL